MKHYRVKKDTFLWKAGAILSDQDKGQYLGVEDIWDTVPLNKEYVTALVIEHPNNADTFERVYPDTISGKLYHTKDQLVAIYDKAFK